MREKTSLRGLGGLMACGAWVLCFVVGFFFLVWVLLLIAFGFVAGFRYG